MKLTQKELKEWYTLYLQYINGWHLEPEDKRELLRLNHIVITEVHKVHNDNQLTN